MSGGFYHSHLYFIWKIPFPETLLHDLKPNPPNHVTTWCFLRPMYTEWELR